MSPLVNNYDFFTSASNKNLQSFDGAFPKEKIEIIFEGDHLLTFNCIHTSILYGFGRYFGTPVGIKKPRGNSFLTPLELSFFEARYLLEHDKIEVISADKSKIYSFNDLTVEATKRDSKFAEKYSVYRELRDKAYIPRSGHKFGADFIVYKKGPGIDHSLFCIMVLSPHQKVTSLDVVRSARLANSVKKKFVLVNPLTGSYFSFNWYKP